MAAKPEAPPAIQVRGARVHNLKNIDVDIPYNALTVVTGVSGSGKSSLAFDTLYADGQRRYVESLSAYARQFLERMERPDVDAIEGIAPAVAIRQKSASRSPRSTVATATEIYDFLRLLFARVGRTWCPDCNLPVGRSDVDTVVAEVIERAAGRRCQILFPASPPEAAVAPPARSRARRAPRPRTAKAAPAPPDAAREWLAELRAKGFNRLWQDGHMAEFSVPESLLQLDFTRPVFVLLDRLAIEPESRARLVDAIETAYHAAGEVLLQFPDDDAPERGGSQVRGSKGEPTNGRRGGEDPESLGHGAAWRFSERFECHNCGRRFEVPEPALFSFNHPIGACPRCQGFGNTTEVAEDRVIPNPALSLAHGAIEPWTKPRGARWLVALKKFAGANDIPMDRPWRELSPEQRRQIWEGEGKFPGVVGFFEHLESKKYKIQVRVFLSRYRGYSVCPECGGARLRSAALAVQLESQSGQRHNISTLSALTVAEAYAFLAHLQLEPSQKAVAAAIWLEVRRRCEFLLKVGLDYLSLDRLASTLSGGEAQRIQLATCLGAQLAGSLYVLDEPSIGLHPRDTARLIAILRELRDLGNSILVVEHDPDVMRAADCLLDLGPGAGERGGRLVAQGTWQQVRDTPESLTGRYLRGEQTIPVPVRRRIPGRRLLHIEGARVHNLRDLDVEIPLDLLVAVAGVSGSGKSSLVHDVLYRNLTRELNPAVRAASGNGDVEAPAPTCRRISGLHHLNHAVMVDQSPIGRTPRSNPVTYIKAFDGIRECFARQPEARRRGYRAGHFSFNLAGGRCEACQGEGVVTVDMQFLADVELVCEECNGTRYQSGILEVTYKGKNIHQVLQLTVDDACKFFSGESRILRPLQLLAEIGLGYLRLGQSATTLSGGEAQRLKLAAHLAQPRSADRTLFLFDEPTTGLHVDDIAKLLAAFERLIAAGGSVLVIEHNLEVLKAADWIIELGPEAGAGGGLLVAEGPPELVAERAASLTAPYLAAHLAQH